MAYKTFDDMTTGGEAGQTPLTLTIDGNTLDLPDASYVRDADIGRDGMDLVLNGPDGTIIVEGYFAADPTPNLTAPDGETLTPELVESFAHSPMQYADAGSMNDASPVGAVQEVSGEASVTRLDGSIEPIAQGTAIYQGDVVETSGDGAVNIVFADETSFAVSEDARLAIDEYVYDPSSQSGTSNFSVLKGVFVFTSGLIGRDDPDDVEIDTPVGSIGIRGTIIMGDVDEGEITVVEGAIVLRDLQGNEMTMTNQFETGKFMPNNGGIEHMGEMSAHHMSQKFVGVSTVAPELFSSLNDSDSEGADDGGEAGEGDLLLEEQKPLGEEGEIVDEVIQQPDVMPGANPFTGQHEGGLLDVEGSIDFRPDTHDGPDPLLGPQGPDGPHHDPLHLGDTLGDNPPPPPSGTSNNAPIFHGRSEPNVFFAASEGNFWNYHFDKDFNDPDPGDTLTFQLHSNTISDLNNTGSGFGQVLDTGQGGGDGWDFNAATGHLQLWFNNDFSGDGLTNIQNEALNINIVAIDGDGASTSSSPVIFNALDTTIAWTTSLISPGQVMSGSGGADTTDISGSSSVVFTDNGNDTITISGGNNSTIHGGHGDDTITVQTAGNIIVGGHNNDRIILEDTDNKAYGGDGDDNFVFGNLDVIQLMGGSSTQKYDGGWNNFRFLGQGQGRGDTLEFTDGGALNFSAIMTATGNTIENFERIDINNGASNNVTLDYNDVMELTDHNNTLVINLDSVDSLNFTGGTLTKTQDNIVLNDAPDGAGVDNQTYDVYSDGTITLLVQDTGAALNGLPP